MQLLFLIQKLISQVQAASPLISLHRFAVQNNISSCGIIAHSQGGLASLHLYTYYWSCLDDASIGGNRLIQAVGSPYQGTPLAGTIAAIGAIVTDEGMYEEAVLFHNFANNLRLSSSFCLSIE